MIDRLNEDFLVLAENGALTQFKKKGSPAKEISEFATKGNSKTVIPALTEYFQLDDGRYQDPELEAVSAGFLEYLSNSYGVEKVKGPFQIGSIRDSWDRIPELSGIGLSKVAEDGPFPGLVVGGDDQNCDFIMLVPGLEKAGGARVLTYEREDLAPALQAAEELALENYKADKKRKGFFRYFLEALAEQGANWNMRRLVLLQAEMHLRANEKINKTDVERIILRIFMPTTEFRNLNRVRSLLQRPEFKFVERYRQNHNRILRGG